MEAYPGATKLFDSSQIPDHIKDLTLVNTETQAGMKMFWEPQMSVDFINSEEAHEAMDSVRQFSFDKSLLRQGTMFVPFFVGLGARSGWLFTCDSEPDSQRSPAQGGRTQRVFTIFYVFTKWLGYANA